ncbi:MAG: hypothetical protein NVV73_21220 [Cellvibrionaceae bacterium]|nr:hypothetical protein [Cellvibrionaceae bacterium]
MNFETWTVDLASSSAIHASGFKLVVEGDPSNPMGVHPGKFPDGLTAVQQARLLRCGLEAIMNQAQSQGWKQEKSRFAERVQAAPAVVHKPSRPILSLKK